MFALTLALATGAFSEQTPKLVFRSAVSYVGVGSTETMDSMKSVVSRSMPKLKAYMAKHGLHPIGAPLIRFQAVQMPQKLNVVVALPLAVPAKSEGDIQSGLLPAGMYAELVYLGPYSGLVAANVRLQSWLKLERLHPKMIPDSSQTTFQGRFEIYANDPAVQKDQSKLETDIFYLVAR